MGLDLTGSFGPGGFTYGGQNHPWAEGVIVPDSPSEEPFRSVSRIPDGYDSDDTASDWDTRSPTPGGPNA